MKIIVKTFKKNNLSDQEFDIIESVLLEMEPELMKRARKNKLDGRKHMQNSAYFTNEFGKFWRAIFVADLNPDIKIKPIRVFELNQDDWLDAINEGRSGDPNAAWGEIKI